MRRPAKTVTSSHMTISDGVIIIGGALIGGFVSGLAGFGTALMTVGIWLHSLEPAMAATLTLICSVSAQLQSLRAIWKDIDPWQVLPFVVPGLIGVPIGLWVFPYVDPHTFKLLCGLFLVGFASFMLLWRGQPAMLWGGRWADGATGLLAGILGGMAGLSGALPTVWASLRGWGKDQKRSIFQVFNLTILGAALLAHIVAGRLSSAMILPVTLALPGTLAGAWIGFRVYRGLSDRNFSDLVMTLVLLSGAILLLSSV